jgi:ceramide glucosyltransferase
MSLCFAAAVFSVSVALWRLLLAAALVGTASSTVFFVMVMAAALRNRRKAREMAREAEPANSALLPAVTILKPLHGAEPRLEENLGSFFVQEYPDYEIVVGCRQASDPALEVVERLRARYPQVKVRVVLSGEPEWPSAKVWSLEKMIASTQNDYMVISDSDILVRPDFLRNVIPPLLDRANGLVTCLYAGVPAPDFWSVLEALGMSVEMASGVITAEMLEGMQFALGSVMAVRRDALEKAGGISATAEYYSDDFVLGNRVYGAGYKVALSHYRVGHVLCTQSFRKTVATQMRWMQSTRYSRPKGHLGTGLTFAIPFGLLGLAAGMALGYPALGWALLAAAVVNRMAQCLVVGYGLIGDRRALEFCWLYPLRDLMGFFVWAASYLGGSSFRWRGELYRFKSGGRIVSVRRTDEARPD